MKARWILEAAGVDLLLMVPCFLPLILPFNISLYHHRLPLTHILLGLLLDLCAVLVVASVALALLSRLPPLSHRIVGACLAGLVLWRAVVITQTAFHLWHSNLNANSQQAEHISGVYEALSRDWSHSKLPLAIAAVLLLASLAWLRPRFSEFLVRVTRFGLAAFAFSGLWIVPKLVYLAFVRPPSVAAERVSAPPHTVSSGRIVWMLFDELSFNLVFDHPPSGLSFPNFEGLRAESTSFDDLGPAGFYTDRVVPSVLAGFKIDRIASTSNGGLLYLDSARHRWMAYDPRATLLGLAQAEGWNPGVAGWYIPYCRTFATVLSTCTWSPGIQADVTLEGWGASESKSTFANAMVAAHAFLAHFSKNRRSARTKTLAENIEDYRNVTAAAEKLIHNEDIRFVFLHLPVPHPPGIYNRRTHELTEGGNYLDNLALADDTLGLLLQTINATASADRTTVIVTSDHSWRVPLWRSSPDWSSEEERVSGGRFDPRPVLLIHFPGQNNKREVMRPLPELMEYDIVAAMLRRGLNSASDLCALVACDAPAGRQAKSGAPEPSQSPPLQ